ncbi:MAG TPA: response regulator [Patescibacteria group bacterium]|nr:response regulator [Patescibacteria group bacterium]
MTQKKAILLIDDDPVTNMINEHYISSQDGAAQITAFLKPQEALEKLRDGAMADVIFLDINMPEMDGWQFLDEFQKLEKTAKVFILSSSIDPNDIKRSKQYVSVVGFISKPLTSISLKRLMV